jgi:hypothetical protein
MCLGICALVSQHVNQRTILQVSFPLPPCRFKGSFTSTETQGLEISGGGGGVCLVLVSSLSTLVPI